MREAIGAKALHAAAFVVDADQQVGPQPLDAGAQRRELRAALPVAPEQNQPAHQRMRQAAAVVVGQLGASDVDDQGGVLHGFRYYDINSFLRLPDKH